MIKCRYCDTDMELIDKQYGKRFACIVETYNCSHCGAMYVKSSSDRDTCVIWYPTKCGKVLQGKREIDNWFKCMIDNSKSKIVDWFMFVFLSVMLCLFLFGTFVILTTSIYIFNMEMRSWEYVSSASVLFFLLFIGICTTKDIFLELKRLIYSKFWL